MKLLPTILASFIFLTLFPAANGYVGEIAVIVNAAGPLTEISEADIREIYLGNMKVAGGVAIVPIHYKEGPVKDKFLSSIIGMDSKSYRLYWTKKVFQEGGSLPVSQNNPQLIMLLVRKNAGAIGYVPASELDEVEGIKIITKIKAE
ncbi:MAG: hypothetical protein HY266_00215 [Deltaproteobacteria bacterium]|nr:hypothetical protein [Deltaproteobacteria bacterium]